MSAVDDFFETARERHSIYLRRKKGLPREAWTDDPIFRRYSFCNLYRELDRTTIWFRENVRDTLTSKPEVLLATVLFRWFNRVETGEAIFVDKLTPERGRPYTAWDSLLQTGDVDFLRKIIVGALGSGPYVTGAYVILGQQGMSKLDGVLKCVGDFSAGEYLSAMFPVYAEVGGESLNWRALAEVMLENPGKFTLEQTWQWLKQVPYLGPFMAYEIVSDLRWTKLLDQAPDVLTWANPGPGAARGLARLHGRPITRRRAAPVPRAQLLGEMRELLELSRRPEYWPQVITTARKGSHIYMTKNTGSFLDFPDEGSWPAWEMREVEHWLCEFDKKTRLDLGEGSVKKSFKPRESLP